ncbi:MAG: HupE/UreJ family protein [Gemmatimonadota bacterium]|nr:HupE/UreJ family protein [Gemmatimonadota bacterium]
MGVAHLRALICITVVLIVPVASAHEIGTTQVHALFRKDHTYVIQIVTAPQALLNKLEAGAGRPRSPQLPPAALNERLRAFAPALAAASEIRFGGVRVAPNVTVKVPEMIELSGPLPESASNFTWRYNLTYAAYALTLQNEGHGEPARQWLEGDQTSAAFPIAGDIIPPSRLDIVRQYLALGFTHIVPHGLDHILFVLGIFLLSTRLKPVLAQVTAFTIAHSITLGLTIYGLVSISPRVVEPAIALSIAYVAIENLTTSQLKPWRVAIVFAFGLLHGMGFAGVLKDLGLPRGQFLPALITFNVGVEAGQLTVIAAAWLLVAWWARTRPWYRHRFVMPASALIAATGIFWTVQRIVV